MITSALVFITTLALVVWFDMWLDRKFPCTCGRQRIWYFDVQHERGGLMMARASWVTTVLVVWILITSPLLVVIWALLATWTWRKWWFHEKDKLKKKATKLAGVVGFNEHGKLVVKQVEA